MAPISLHNAAPRAAVRVRRLASIAEFDRHRARQTRGATDTASWLMTTCGQSRASATTEVTVARALEHLPAITAAAARGMFSWDQLVALAALATPDTDAELAVRHTGPPGGWSSSGRRAR